MGTVEMNMKMLFSMQKELDDHILQEQGLKKLPYAKTVLAFIVELGECANEWMGFKYWKQPENRQPRIMAQRGAAMMPEDQDWYNPMLEEYVDKLHVLLSLGLEVRVNPENYKNITVDGWKCESITEQFLLITGKAHQLYLYKNSTEWDILFKMFMALGEMLGFTWDQVQDAYMKKNAINHTRQVLKY